MLTGLTSFECNQGVVRAVRFTEGLFGLTCGADKTIKMWDLRNGRCVNTYGGHISDVFDAMSSCDSSRIVSGSNDASMMFWDFSTATPIRRLIGHNGAVTCVHLNEDSTVLVSGGLDHSVCIWDARAHNATPQVKLVDAQLGVTAMRVFNHEILTGSLDGVIRRYDMRNHKLFKFDLEEPISCLNYSKDGQCILASVIYNDVRLFDKDNYVFYGEYTGHSCMNIRIESCLNSDDSVVISGSLNGYIYVWDRASSLLSYKLVHAPGQAVQTISFHQNKENLLSGSATIVKFWGK